MSVAARTIHGFWRLRASQYARRFGAALVSPEVAQRNILERIIRSNEDTDFGRAHGFSRIRSAEEFSDAVPPREYEGFRQWVDSAAEGRKNVLTMGRPLAFLPTSGTSSGCKLIPWTASLAAEFHAALDPWIHGFMRSEPAAWNGAAYWSLSPPTWPEHQTRGGIRIGFADDSEYLPAWLRPLLGAVFAVPSSVARERDPEAWKISTLVHLLAASDLSLVSIWSPTFLLSLLETMQERWEELLRMLPSHASRRRVRELHDLTTIRPDLIWPRLAAISCWADASSRASASRLAELFPQARIHPKGLVATEGVVSIPWPGSPVPVLAVCSHFFEFVDDRGISHPAWELEAGGCYSVLLTTGGGLYRYRLHDRIRVSGHLHQCPLVEFLGREGIVSDLCGEKLAEPFVRECLEHLLGHKVFCLMAPASGDFPHYRLFHTGSVVGGSGLSNHDLDEQLCKNPHYAHARRIGQLAAPVVTPLAVDDARAWSCYQRVLTSRGMRTGDIKPSVLDHQSGWEHAFDPPCP